MKFCASIVAVLVMTAMPSWAQFVSPGGIIPVVANNPGVNSTFWRSDVSILNTSEESTTVILALFPELVNGEPEFEVMFTDEISIPPGGQKTITNVVQSQFGLFDKKGSLWVSSTNFQPLVVSSRTFTFGDAQCSGSYGQDVTSVLVANEAWVAGLEHSSSFRTNLGIFLPFGPDFGGSVIFTVEIRDTSNEIVATGSLVYHQSGLQQVNLDTFGVGLVLNGSLHIVCSDPSMLWYGYTSTIDQTSGDAVYRTATGRQQDLP